MTDLMDAAAADLAGMLRTCKSQPHQTAWLSMLDEATIAWGDVDASIATAQRAFGQARYAHQRSYSTATGGYSDERWQAAMEAAESLASALDRHGDRTLLRCKARTGWGACNAPMDEGQTCRSESFHEEQS